MQTCAMTHRRTRRAITLATLSLLMAGTGAAHAQDAALIEAAKREGELVWYTGLIVNTVVRPLIQAFEKKYGITVHMTSVSLQSEVVLRVTSEMRAGKPVADVIEGGGQMIPPLVRAGALERYSPVTAAGYAPEFKSKDGYWTIPSINYLTAAINTELVKASDAPRTFEDLLDPKWKGKMVWSVDLNTAGAPGVVGNILQGQGQQAGMEFLRKLARQNIVGLAINQRAVLDQVVAGQYPLALTTFFHHVVTSREKGAPVQWLPLEPVITVGNVTAIVRNAPHPNAAKLFVNFILSEEGQMIYREANYVTTHPNVKSKLPEIKPGGFRTLVISPEMSEQNLPIWTQVYKDVFL